MNALLTLNTPRTLTAVEPIEIGPRGLQNRADMSHAGVVDEHVDIADVRRGCGARRLVGDIERVILGGAAARANRAGDPLASGRIAIRHEHPGARRCQRARRRFADS